MGEKPKGFVPDGFVPDEPQAPVAPERSMLGTALEVGKGIVKGAAGTVAGIGELAANAGVLGLTPRGFDPAMRHPAFTRAEELTRAENTPQMIGKGLETAAELAVPVGQTVNAIPRAARAGRAFQSVMGAAKNVPVNADAAGEVGLRIMQLTERGGGSLPRPVSQFLQRITHPEKAPLAYEEARDFASGISRLSANETMKLGPAVKREIAELRVLLNKAVADAAGKAGKGREYSQAMTEYAKAMKMRKLLTDVGEGMRQALPIAGAGAAGGWLVNKMMGK